MIAKSAQYIYNYYVSPGFGRSKYQYPTHVNFPITDNCNSKCRMCNVWKDKSENELLPEQIEQIYSDKLFKNVQHLGISGGEPTLRKDLLECVDAILNSLVKLKSLSITSHGFHPTKWKRLLPEIMAKCEARGVFFKLNISVDGIGELHEEVRRIEGGWKKVVESLEVAKENACPVQLQCTVSKHNTFGVNEVKDFATKNDFEVIFRKATTINRLYNKGITKEFHNTSQEDSFLIDFLESNDVKKVTPNPARRLFYKELGKMVLNNDSRKAPCHFQYNGVLISAHGEMFICSIDEEPLGNCLEESPEKIYFSDKAKAQLEYMLSDVCPSCVHDQSGAWNPIALIGNMLEDKLKGLNKASTYAKFGVRNFKKSAGLLKRKVRVDAGNQSQTLHIIGAYGGEHVGDSAILGGVILRQLARRAYDQIVVYSKRKDRTEFWIKGLDFKQSIDIHTKDYEVLNDISVGERDVLVWAGGPIMEMPQDLFEHNMTIEAFKKAGIPFEITGCGWGPFKTGYSSRLAHKVLHAASDVEMRDKYELPKEYRLNRDPAFDYLYSEYEGKEEWSWSMQKTKEFFDKIQGESKKDLILLNLRPIWSKYNKSAKSSDELDDFVVQKTIEVIENMPENQIMVSVPFNTDHYGFSDMNPALAIKQICKERGLESRYKVFDRELNAREMKQTLGYFKAGICMRFHACIFMRSMGIPVYGIDYTAGEKGKVAGLFKSFDDPNVMNILNLEAQPILDFLNELE